MESYRQCEKEGKRGNTRGDNFSQDEKTATRAWIQKAIQSLTNQVNSLENELKLKASDVSALERIITLEHILDRNRFHITHLGKILRGFDQDKIDQDQIDQIKEAVNEYIERNQVRLCFFIIFILNLMINE